MNYKENTQLSRRLRRIILLIVFVWVLGIMLVSCACNKDDNETQMLINRVTQPKYGELEILKIDGCEYILWYMNKGGSKIIHHESCENQKHYEK